MKVMELIELLKELPQDYDMCFCQYTSLVIPKGNLDDDDVYFVVLDDPLIGLIHNDENKEVRLITSSSEEEVLKDMENGKKWKTLE
jgi:hypothetical protein